MEVLTPLWWRFRRILVSKRVCFIVWTPCKVGRICLKTFLGLRTCRGKLKNGRQREIPQKSYLLQNNLSKKCHWRENLPKSAKPSKRQNVVTWMRHIWASSWKNKSPSFLISWALTLKRKAMMKCLMRVRHKRFFRGTNIAKDTLTTQWRAVR